MLTFEKRDRYLGEAIMRNQVDRINTVQSLVANYESVHTDLAKIENVSTSDARTNASVYRRYMYLEDRESIVAVVVA